MTNRPEHLVSAAEKSSVTAAEIIRNFGYWQQCALEAPVAVTHHGRSRVVLISSEQYRQLSSKATTIAVSSDAEARRIMEHAIEGFLVYDAELRLIHANKVARDFFGSHFDGMINRAADAPERAPVHPEILARLREVLETRKDVAFDTDSKRFPGRRLRLRIFPYGDGVAILFMNITEMEHLRAGANRMHSLRRAVQAISKVGVIMLDPREQLVLADRVVTELTGFTTDDLKDLRLINFIHAEDRDLLAAMLRQPLASRKAVTVRVLVKSGETRWMKVVVVPIGYDFSPIGDLIMFTPVDAPVAA